MRDTRGESDAFDRVVVQHCAHDAARSARAFVLEVCAARTLRWWSAYFESSRDGGAQLAMSCCLIRLYCSPSALNIDSSCADVTGWAMYVR